MVRDIRGAGTALILALAGTLGASPITARFLGEEGFDGSQASLRERLLAGRNIQVLVGVPEAEKPGGRMLDPISVDVSWNGESLDQFLYYKTPQMALLFAILTPEALREKPTGELLVRARLQGSSNDDLTTSVALQFTPAEVETIATAQARDGRSVLLLDPEKKPVGGGFVFGQRREDLYTLSDAEGVAILDRPARSSSSTHFAGREGFWTLSFDPVSSRTLTLTPRTEVASIPVELSVKSTSGEDIGRGLLLVENTYYLWWEAGAPIDLYGIPDREIEATVMAPGYSPQLLKVVPDQPKAIVRLAPLSR